LPKCSEREKKIITADRAMSLTKDNEKLEKDAMYANFICHAQCKRKYFTTASEVSRPKNLAKPPLFKENYFSAKKDKSRYSVTIKAHI
jgi:hypothetical protein